MSTRKRKIIVTVIVVLMVLLLIVPFGLSAMIYEDNFGDRYETYAPMARSVDEFDGLNVKRYTFSSDQGQNLVGYQYQKTLEIRKELS